MSIISPYIDKWNAVAISQMLIPAGGLISLSSAANKNVRLPISAVKYKISS